MSKSIARNRGVIFSSPRASRIVFVGAPLGSDRAPCQRSHEAWSGAIGSVPGAYRASSSEGP
ncbi:hypothetical protein SCE1572_36280 [Sorangium cellulosum So0157-2]|uniref:Uncharacterized protein n=1 Tax=Sorangium cellulosum So0157-2 TaxID=1254432 RepID=S4Y3X4_SORCE|nr:hypothetical protein SCE1572_36280 [Sorangium cellulosum So0157-2]